MLYLLVHPARGLQLSLSASCSPSSVAPRLSHASMSLSYREGRDGSRGRPPPGFRAADSVFNGPPPAVEQARDCTGMPSINQGIPPAEAPDMQQSAPHEPRRTEETNPQAPTTPTHIRVPLCRALLPAISAGWLLGSARTELTGSIRSGYRTVVTLEHQPLTRHLHRTLAVEPLAAALPPQPCISHRRRRGRRSSRRLRRVRHPTTSAGWLPGSMRTVLIGSRQAVYTVGTGTPMLRLPPRMAPSHPTNCTRRAQSLPRPERNLIRWASQPYAPGALDDQRARPTAPRPKPTCPNAT